MSDQEIQSIIDEQHKAEWIIWMAVKGRGFQFAEHSANEAIINLYAFIIRYFEYKQVRHAK